MASISKELNRRYLIRAGGSMLAYLLSLGAAEFLVESHLVDGPLVWLLALLPGLAVMGFIWAMALRMIEQPDEYLRMLMVRQMLVATGITISLATIWGFLEEFALVQHARLYWVFVLWCFCQGLGALFNRITLGSWGDCW